MMERVSDEWICRTLSAAQLCLENERIAVFGREMAQVLEELKASRKAEKEHGHTDHSANGKEDAGATQEKPVLPIPCTKGFENLAVKDYFQKINEELDEPKEGVFLFRKERIAEEAADTITAITSMLEAMGIDEQQRQAAQRRVNARNRERNRI